MRISGRVRYLFPCFAYDKIIVNGCQLVQENVWLRCPLLLIMGYDICSGRNGGGSYRRRSPPRSPRRQYRCQFFFLLSNISIQDQIFLIFDSGQACRVASEQKSVAGFLVSWLMLIVFSIFRLCSLFTIRISQTQLKV